MRAFLLTLPLCFGCGPMLTPVPDAGRDLLCNGAAKTPANLLENGAFECDPSPATWRALYGTLELGAGGRTGRAAKVTVNAAGGRMSYAKDFAVDAGMKTFCFSAWLTGTAPSMRLRVLRVFPANVQEDQFSELIFPDWKRIPTFKVSNDQAPKLQLVFEVQTNRTDGLNAVPGDTMLIDDVDVWEGSANCSETR